MNLESVRIDKDQDIMPVTVGLYRQFLAHGQIGMEALILYLHLIFTARLQETYQVKADDVYLRNGLHIGVQKLKRLKSLLHELRLIEYVQRRDRFGQMTCRYIRVKFWPSERAFTGGTEIVPPETESRPAGTKTVPPVSASGTENRPTGSEKQMLKKREEKNKSRNPSGSATPSLYSAEHFRLAEKLATHVESLDSKVFTRKDRQKTITAWAGDMERLERLDGRTVKEIDAVLEWVTEDDFWSTNILSGGKLRKQFSTLVSQLNGHKNGKLPERPHKQKRCTVCGEFEDSNSTTCMSCHGALEEVPA